MTAVQPVVAANQKIASATLPASLTVSF
jgi:hypothetical protein